MKKMFLFFILIFMIGCEDSKKLDYDIERLENKCIETKTELEAIKSMVITRLNESNQVIDETQKLIRDNDVFQEKLESQESQTSVFYQYSDDIRFIEYRTGLFSEHRNIQGKLLSHKEDVFEIALEIYWDQVNNKPIYLGELWLVENKNDIVLKRTGEVLKLNVTAQTEFVIGPHGEIVSKERLLDEIKDDTILHLEIINDTIMGVYDDYLGPVIRLDTLH